MHLTQPQRESQYGRLLVQIVQTADTPDELDALESLMRLLMPSMRLYVQAGTLGTQADRLEAMQELRHRAYQRVFGVDPDSNAQAAHVAATHYHS